MRSIQIVANRDDKIGLRVGTHLLHQFCQRNTTHLGGSLEIRIIGNRVTHLRQGQQIFPAKIADRSWWNSGQIPGNFQR